MRRLFLFSIILLSVLLVWLWLKQPLLKQPIKSGEKEISPNSDAGTTVNRVHTMADRAASWCRQNNFNQEVCFLVDMKQPSGKKRFFIYDLNKKVIKDAGLVSHGSCNQTFLLESRFGNEEGCGCSSDGKYKVGGRYKGQFGIAFKLHGLEPSNNNAFKRFVVLHAYDCVPDFETHPVPLCNSLGCPMVSYTFLDKLVVEINKSKRPLLLWVYK